MTSAHCIVRAASCAVRGTAIVATLPALLAAQDISARVAAVRDGTVRMTYATRAGVCGDGDELVGFGRALYIWPSIESHGSWQAPRCAPGDARVAVTVAGGRPVSLRTYVGGSWAGSSGTDLGTVPGPAAAAFFMSLAAAADGRLSRDAILPAVIAEGADIADELLRIGRDRDRPTETRSRALQWVGQLGGQRAVAPLLSIARDGDERRSVRAASLMALSAAPDNSGVPGLLEIVNGGSDGWLREKAVFWLAETEDVRATELLHRLVLQESADMGLRKAAIFALGHQSGTEEDATFLRNAYARLSGHQLREQIIQSVSQVKGGEGARWLASIVLDGRESTELRRHAMFWMGQGDARLDELVALYGRLESPSLKEHFIFVLSQRREDGAVEKLIDIARSDPDREMRKKALFWLGQSEDPRAVRLIRDLVTN